MLAKDIMTSPVFSVGPETLVREVAALLARYRISGVPVLQDGRLVGEIDETDLLHRYEIGTDHATCAPWWRCLFRDDSTPAQYVKSHALRAKDVMNHSVVAADEETELAGIAARFESPDVHRVFVERAQQVVGVVARADLVRVLAARAPAPGTQRGQDDEQIRGALLAELQQQPWWRSDWSAVSVSDGVVQFRGVILTPDEKRAARVAAENIPGVRAVEDFRWRSIDQRPML